jgi:hypothetical protein
MATGKKNIIYGHRGKGHHPHHLKIGKASRVPAPLPNWAKEGCKDPRIKDKAFLATLNRLTDSDHIFGGIDKVQNREEYLKNPTVFLPLIIDLDEEFGDCCEWDSAKAEKLEHDIHRELAGRRVNAVGRDEWFHASLEDDDDPDLVRNTIRKILGKVPGTPYAANERPHQYWGRMRIADAVEGSTESPHIMLELAPRFGKTSFILGYWKLNANVPVLVVPSYILSSHHSFHKAVRKWDVGDDVLCIDMTEERAADKIKNALDSNQKVLLTISMFSDEERVEKYDDVFVAIDDVETVVYVDEADDGGHTKRSQNVVRRLMISDKFRTFLHGTGTNIERASHHGHPIARLIRVTYTDLLEAQEGRGFLFESEADGRRQIGDEEKEALKVLRGDMETYVKRLRNIVRPVHYRLDISPELKNKLEADLRQTPSWSAIHASTRSSEWIKSIFRNMLHEDYASQNIGWYLPDILQEVAESKETELPPEPRAYMFFGSSTISGLHRMKEAAEQALPMFICECLDSTVTNNRDAEELVNSLLWRAKAEGKEGVLVFSMKMGSRSFSVPNVSVVVECYDGGGIYTAHQKHSRALTPGHGKEFGLVVNLSFDPNRVPPYVRHLADQATQELGNDDDLSEILASKLRVHSLFKYSEDGEKPLLSVQVEDLERIALDSNRIADMMLLDKSMIDSILEDPTLLASMAMITKASSDLSNALEKKLDRVLEKTESTSTEESSGITEQTEGGDEEQNEVNLTQDDVLAILRHAVIVTQNIGLQISHTEANTVSEALDIIKQEGLEADLQSWLGGVEIDIFKKILANLKSSHLDSAFRVARSASNNKWLDEYRGE